MESPTARARGPGEGGSLGRLGPTTERLTASRGPLDER